MEKNIKQILEDAVEVVIPLVNLPADHKEIYDAIFTGESDADLGKRLGLTKSQIRGKRQNLHSKVGYKFLDLLSVYRATNK